MAGTKRRKGQSAAHQSNSADDKRRGDVTSRRSQYDLPFSVWFPMIFVFLSYVCYFHMYSRPDVQKKRFFDEQINKNTSVSSGGLEWLRRDVDWIPSRPAKIDDPVDDRDFPYNVLSSFKPKPLRLEDRDIIPLALKYGKKVNNSSVRAYIVDDLLSSAECDVLRSVHDQHIRDMSHHDPIICFADLATMDHHVKRLGQNFWISPKILTPGTRCVNSSLSSQLLDWGLRWSYGTGFYLGESKFSIQLSKRIADVVGFHEHNGGAFRVVSYLPNVGYKLHTDCASDGSRGKEDRYGTVLVYLDDVDKGGQTYFPDLGIYVKPKKGRALVWNNMRASGECDPRSKHAAEPVLKGHKYILQRWYYYQNFPGMQKRPPIPPKPVRQPSQAHVMCDEHKYGSCRWYDVWTYDVLTGY